MLSISGKSSRGISTTNSDIDYSLSKDKSSNDNCCDTLRRSATLTRQTEMVNLVSNSNGAIYQPSKLHIARHLLGFRTYNRVHDIERKLKEGVLTINLMLQTPFMGLQLALEAVESSLSELQCAEYEFYRTADHITKYEHKVKELDFLKANVERCITTSIANVKAELKQVASSSLDKFSDPSTASYISKINDLIKQPWRGHSQLRTSTECLKIISLPTYDLESMIPDLHMPDKDGIVILLKNIEAYLKARDSQSKIAQIMTSNIDEEELTKFLEQINNYQAQISNAVALKEAVASVVLNLSFEAKATTYVLQQRTKEIKNNIAGGNFRRDIDTEESILMEFIYNGRRFATRESEDKDDLGKTPSKRLFMQTGSQINLNIPDCAPSRPVWAQTWTSKTKILKKHGNK